MLLDEILADLCSLVRDEAKNVTSEGSSSSGGHSFEDAVSRRVHKLSKQLGFQSISARHVLDLPTFSGIKHQFDCSFTIGNATYAVECKRRKLATKNQVYYFNSTVSDYLLGCRLHGLQNRIRGVFLSTAEVDDNSLAYAMSYGMTVIDPVHPPIETMIKWTKDGDLLVALNRLKERMPSESPLAFPTLRQEFSSSELLREYLFLLSRSQSVR